MTKKILSVVLLLCMFISLIPGAAFAAEADDSCDFKSLINAKLYVKANKDAGLDGDVVVSFDTLSCNGTVYLPGSADTSKLFLSWDNDSLVVAKNGTVYENGTAPIAPDSGTAIYNITKGKISVNVMITTVKGAEAVAGMFINIDESMGTIDAMNSDSDHETQCFGAVSFDGDDYPYISMKGRGNSTWVFEKKPYNITFYKKADYDKKQNVSLIDGVKAKKWTLLANYLDSSLLRNKIAFDLAQDLGIGLDSRFVDVWMNGEYLGNYLMTPKKDYNTPDNGYIIENDHIDDDTLDNQFDFPDIAEMPFKHNRLNVEDIGDDAVKAGVDVAYVEEHFTKAWATVLDTDSEEYQNYFDLDSWAKMYLMFEVSKTYDCYAGNIIMHRDGLSDDDKLIAGPVWDYDIAFGRTLHKFFVGVTEHNQLNAEGWYNDSVGFVASSEPYSILQGLGMHESFIKRVAEIYNEYKWAFEDIAANVDRQQELIEGSALMNNVLWGTNHIGADYAVSPTVFSALGTGSYKLNYVVTTEWDDYVANLKEFCTKRVLWLSNHLYAETPEGSITQALSNQDTVVLRVNLTEGNQDNTYQWQSSKNGKKWADIEGATAATLKLAATEENTAKQYRCVVKNAGVKIYTTHGGWTKASATNTITADKIRLTTVEDEIELCETTCTLVLNGKDMGEFTFAQYNNGWSICNADGRYVSVDGKKLALSDKPFVWSFDNGVFSASIKTSYTKLGSLLGIGKTQTAYLSQSSGSLTVSLEKGAAAEFVISYTAIA